MPSTIFRLIVLCGVLAPIAGCGGSSGAGSGTNTATTITYNFGGPAPTAVAVKIGSGNFAPATLTGGKLSFTLPDGTTDFAVAYACPGFSPLQGYTQNFEYLNYASSLDKTKYMGGCISSAASGPGGGSPPTGTLTGSVNSSSFPAASELFVWALAANVGSGNSFNLTESDAFSMSDAPLGTDAVTVSLYDSSWNALAVKSVGSQTVPGPVDSGSPIEFGAGDATTFQPITYSNVPAGYSVPSTAVSVEAKGLPLLMSMNGDNGFSLGNQSPLSQYSMLPASLAQSGDQYQIESTATMQMSSVISEVRTSETLTGGGPAAISFPVPWSYVGPTPAALPTVDFSYTGITGQSGLIYSADFQWAPASGISDSISISLTQNYQSAFPSVTVPDPSAIPGLLVAPASGTTVSWYASIGNGISLSTGTLGSLVFTTSGASPNATSSPSSSSASSASSFGTYTVP